MRGRGVWSEGGSRGSVSQNQGLETLGPLSLE